MYIQRFLVPLVTAADGSLTAYSPTFSGRVLGIRYVKTDFADGSTMTLTAEATGQAIWSEANVNASATRYPRVPVQDNAGADLTYDGTHKVYEPVALAVDRVKIVIANGGDAKSGALHIIVG